MKDREELADRLMSALCIIRDRSCTTCGSKNQLQPGHFIHRTHKSVRWCVGNVALQCAQCNRRHNLNPEPLRRVIERRVGVFGINDMTTLAGMAGVKQEMDWVVANLRKKILELPRFRQMSEKLQRRVLNGNFTNLEVAGFLHGLTEK